MTQGFIVGGTSTGVGKTIVSAGLTTSLNAKYWKPIQAGLDEETDSECVARLTGRPADVLPEAYRFNVPCSPHEAARHDAVTIEDTKLERPACDEPLIIEGAGGLLVPIGEGRLMIDFFDEWALPIILVASTALGTINHSLLSLEALRARTLKVAGIIFVGKNQPCTQCAIIRYGRVRCLGRLPWLDPLNPQTLKDNFSANVSLDML